ncbi:MAG: hypothetical protein PVH61_16310 [Candidatus Aminicenantes bacterium]
MNNKLIKPALFILMIFFTLQLFSHLFLKLGEGKTGGKTSGLFKWSALLMPLDAEPVYKYAYALLFENVESQNNEMILKSIRAFEKSLHYNVLFYRAYYYLGKALFFYHLPSSPYFTQGVRTFKRAALIRGNKNSNISRDTLVLFLSQWPLLNDEDKIFCRDLLENSIRLLKGKNFDSILEAWRLYCRDINFFKGILKKNPAYYLTIAKELNRMGINLEMRQDFLSGYEVYRLDQLKTTYQKYREESTDLLAQLKNLYKRSNIEGYYRLAKNSDFNEKEYLDFKKELKLHIVQLLFDQPGWQTDIKKRQEIERYIFDYFNDAPSRKEVERLNELLYKNDFFSQLLNVSTSHLPNFYIKQLVHFKLGNYNKVIEDIERLRQSVAFVQKEHLDDYTDILLLLADAYVKNKHLTMAMSLLEEIEKISPGLMDTCWRMKKIELIIGPSNEREKEKIWAEKYRDVMDSRFIDLGSLHTRKTVYLVDSHDIVIRINDRLKGKLKPGNLFQVFIDGKIYYEAYISQLMEEDSVEVKFEESPAKCEVLAVVSSK